MSRRVLKRCELLVLHYNKVSMLHTFYLKPYILMTERFSSFQSFLSGSGICLGLISLSDLLTKSCLKTYVMALIIFHLQNTKTHARVTRRGHIGLSVNFNSFICPYLNAQLTLGNSSSLKILFFRVSTLKSLLHCILL
jgi:hypothetical protein